MANKEIYKSSDIEDKILKAVDLINDPIKQTMSPMGGDVIYEDNNGIHHSTNDGVTIAKNIYVKDPIINQTIQVIKGSALKTNTEAGDGTSSTILLSSVLIKEGLRLLRSGWNQVNICQQYDKIAKQLKDIIAKEVNVIKTDDDLLHIANVSSSNNKEIAQNTLKTIKITGKEGQVLIDPGYCDETYLEEDTGFILKNGMFTHELSMNKSFASKYENILTFITDKRLYYDIEAERILTVAKQNGYKEIVVVASDFIGEALPFFVEQHKRGLMKILLIKETNLDILTDLSIYLNGEVISDKSGALDNLTIDNFCVSKMVFSNQQKSIISREKNEDNKELNKRVSAIDKEMKKIGDKSNKDYKELESRIASLTKGMVTIKVGGRTVMEVNDKIFRYEDAVNATRVAIDSGYVVGGGLTFHNAWNKLNKKGIDAEFVRVFDKYCNAIVNQISTNCGVSPEVNLSNIEEAQNEFGTNWGYNAITNKMSDLIKDGIIEPHKVITQVIDNSVSVANTIIKGRFRIINELIEEKSKQ